MDLGSRRTGVAVSDLTGTLAGGLEVIESMGLKECAEKVLDIAEKYNVSQIVLGYPINLNGTRGASSQITEKFKEMLEISASPRGLEITVTLFDERLSTSLAHVYMNQTGIKSKSRKQKIDMLSAQIILQNYLDSKKGADMPSL
ncbi:MAG: Holliday junction resolvase RuvX [Oscillospiraceae bacterium]|nr:Holliday junction resolvase RuvX [Oscillospiraceae bacterium]